MNILDAIRHHARMRPFDLAVVHPSGAINYRQLAGGIVAMGQKLRSHGIQPGQTIAVYVSDPMLHLLLLMGALANGTVTVSAHPNYDPIPATARVDAYLADRELPFAPGAPVIPVGANWLAELGNESAGTLPLASGFQDPDEITRLYTSSGTTGTPKIIGYTSAMSEQSAQRNISLDPYVRGPLLCMMWFSTIGGQGTVQMALWHGVALVLASAPLQVLRSINLYKVANLRASPQQLQALVDTVRGHAVRFPSLERIELGGSSIPTSLLNTARALLCPNVTGVYGSTEAGLIAQVPPAVLHAVPDAAGYVVPDVEVRIVDDTGHVVGFDTEGIVQLRTPTMANGYVGDEQASAAAFRDGWFIPGDLGVLRQDGLLRVTGRADEMINAGGVKLSPVLVDEFLLAQPGVVDAATFAFRQTGRHDEVWAAVVVGPEFNEGAVLEAALKRLNSRAPRKLVRLPNIPRNAMGKPMRQKLSQDALMM